MPEHEASPRTLALLVPSDSGNQITLEEAILRSTDKTSRRRPHTARNPEHYRRAIAESLDLLPTRPMTSRAVYKPLPPPPLPDTFPSTNEVLSRLSKAGDRTRARASGRAREVPRHARTEASERPDSIRSSQFRYLVGPTSPQAKARMQQVGT